MKKQTFNYIVLSILLLSYSWHSGIYSQVTIGSGISPIEGALLDLKEKSTTGGSLNSNKGIIMPRVELKNPNGLHLSDLEILDTDGDGQQHEKHIGLLVYNVSNIFPFCPGLYVWNGSEWIRLPKPCSASCTAPSTPDITAPAAACNTNTVLTATSSGASSFQWYKDGTLLPGENGSTYTALQTGTYTVKAVNGTCESAISTGYTLSDIFKSLVIQWDGVQPNPTAINTAYNFKAADTSGSTGSIAYTWTVTNGIIISGQNTAIAVISFSSGPVSVSVKAANSCGISNELSLSTTIAASCTTPPTPTVTSSSGAVICDGSATLTATSSGAASYQWYRNGSEMSGQTQRTCTVSQTGAYTVIAYSGACQSVISTAYNITSANVKPVISWDGTQTTNPTENTNYTYKIKLSNSATSVYYQWTVTNGTLVSGQGSTSAVIKFNAGSGNIKVDAVNSCGTTTLNLPVSVTGTTSVCGAYVTPTLWKDFMCHNLGADTSKNPFTPNQAIAGDYFQWGVKNSVATAYTDSNPITGWNTATAANGAWSSASKTANDPCPAGYRLPTTAEWKGVMDNNTRTPYPGANWSWSITNFTSGLQIGSKLFLPTPGYRKPGAGDLLYRGYTGYYWTGEQSGTKDAYYLQIGQGSYATTQTVRNSGFSVRCIKQ